MAFELRPGQGTLFQNDQRGNDKAPAYRGELRLEDGTLVKLAGWKKQGAKGPFLSLSIDRPREERTQEAVRAQNDSRRGGAFDEADEGPPF